VSETAPDGWRERARDLHEQGDIPEGRAKIVALAEQGLTNEEIADELDLDSRGSVWIQIDRYRAERDEAEWLAEHGPEL
jgi:hypothetical protein